eukprot:CAMPEP_0169393028 /NCGR_PEP_ID=MMETSP1017-20121227/49129_1 /TAXON_ID=342587 /ORGANISM="Karlodinium micrum, Strain CCMP2283" /LENGTH=73 /DNA_ID=CAMNT_0009496399 /DNA_START=8 /DNA_END=226 /DNA_ORIENTATION=+
MAVRDEAIAMLEFLQRRREERFAVAVDSMYKRSSNPSLQDLKVLWSSEAQAEAQFAYMRKLARTEGFLKRAMA